MYALKDYGSDSDDSIVNVNDDTEKEDKSECETIDNFFGIFPGKSSKLTVNKDEKQLELKDKNTKVDVKVDGQEKITAEIPSSSFWSDLQNDELQILHETAKFTGKKAEHSSKVYVKSTSHREDVIFQQKRSFDHKSGHSDIKKQKTAVQLVTTLNKQGETSETCRNIEKRKLLVIHPKISPVLHIRKKKYVTPKNKEWENPGHGGAINRLKWNVPNYSHLLVTASMDSVIKIWNVWSQLDPCVQVLRGHSKAVRDVDWNTEGNQLLSCSYDKSARIWNIETGVSTSTFDHTSYVTCCKYHSVNHNVSVTGSNNQIQIWDSRTPSAPCKTFTYKDNIGQVQDIVMTGDGSTLFSCTDLVSRDSADRNLMAWDFRTGVVVSNQIYQERFTLNRLQIHPTDRQVLAQSSGNYIAIFSLQRPYKMNKHKRLEGHKLQGYNIGFDISPDGQIIYSGSANGAVYCYNYHSGKQWNILHTGLPVVTDVACHPVLPTTLAMSSWDGTVQVWR